MIPRHGDFFDDPDMAEQLAPDEVWLWQASAHGSTGVDRLAIVNGHGGNYVLANVVQQANIAGPRMTLFPSRTDWEAARTAAGLASTASEDMHAGELEVSLLLHGYPELVGDGYRRADWGADSRPHLLVTACAATPRPA